MLLEEALNKHLLRPVPLQSSGWPIKYKDTDWIDYRQHIGEHLALLNVARKFAYLKNIDNLSMPTLILPNKKKALAYIGNLNPSDYQAKASDWVSVTLTEKLLKTNIANIEDLQSEMDFSFDRVAFKLAQGDPEKLSDVEAVSLICDLRAYQIFDKGTLLTLATRFNMDNDANFGDFSEIINQNTVRGRLLLYERSQGIEKPLALKLFNNKILNRGKALK